MLDNSAIRTFSEQTQQLFEIIGPKAADFVKQKADTEILLKNQYKTQEEFATELAHLQGEFERFSHLIHATDKQISGTEKALEDAKRRTEEMATLNAEVERTITSIPTSIPQIVYTTTHNSSGWWLWGKSSSTTVANTIMVHDQAIHFSSLFILG
ncbi:unnamed protein product [Rotaria sp. Silwood2]|nr:unnamed protein product [Rotaria sp. Silwood2]CAF4479116.1 unnamed protein product [Rotaria sp. Silwood2]